MAQNNPNSEEESREAGTFFQKPKFDAFERLICGHLIEASKAENQLQTVIHICMASLTINDETRARLKIDKDTITRLYTVAQRLASAVMFKRDGTPTVSINFSTLNYDEYVRPWSKMIGYEHTISGRGSDLRELFDKNKLAYFHEANRILTPAGYAHMTSDFLLYSMPLIQDITRQLTTLVSPETYTELMKVYIGEKPQT